MEKKELTKQAKLRLHQVDGFYPETDLMEIPILDEYGNLVETKYYLPLITKETWFWLVYPEGKIKNTVITLNETYVRVECKLYRHDKDAEDEFFVSAEKFLTIDYQNPFYAGRPKEEIIGGHVNAAKAGAESIALSKGGFGIQIESPDDGDLVSDKNYEESLSRILVPTLPGTPKPTEKTTQKTEQKTEQKNNTKDIETKLTASKKSPFTPYQPTANDNHTVNVPLPTVVPSEKPVVVNKSETEPKETPDAKELTLEEARKVVTSSQNQKFKGKTLGEIFDESPLAVPYIANNTTGKERDAAVLLSNSREDTKAKLEQYNARG